MKFAVPTDGTPFPLDSRAKDLLLVLKQLDPSFAIYDQHGVGVPLETFDTHAPDCEEFQRRFQTVPDVNQRSQQPYLKVYFKYDSRRPLSHMKNDGSLGQKLRDRLVKEEVWLFNKQSLFMNCIKGGSILNLDPRRVNRGDFCARFMAYKIPLVKQEEIQVQKHADIQGMGIKVDAAFVANMFEIREGQVHFGKHPAHLSERALEVRYPRAHASLCKELWCRLRVHHPLPELGKPFPTGMAHENGQSSYDDAYKMVEEHIEYVQQTWTIPLTNLDLTECPEGGEGKTVKALLLECDIQYIEPTTKSLTDGTYWLITDRKNRWAAEGKINSWLEKYANVLEPKPRRLSQEPYKAGSSTAEYFRQIRGQTTTSPSQGQPRQPQRPRRQQQRFWKPTVQELLTGCTRTPVQPAAPRFGDEEQRANATPQPKSGGPPGSRNQWTAARPLAACLHPAPNDSPAGTRLATPPGGQSTPSTVTPDTELYSELQRKMEASEKRDSEWEARFKASEQAAAEREAKFKQLVAEREERITKGLLSETIG